MRGHYAAVGTSQSGSGDASLHAFFERMQEALANCYRMQASAARMLNQNKDLPDENDDPSALANDGDRALSRRFLEAGMGFINAELNLCGTFVLLASRDEEERARETSARNARKAYDAVVRYMGRLPCSPVQKAFIEHRLAELTTAAPWLGRAQVAPVRHARLPNLHASHADGWY